MKIAEDVFSWMMKISFISLSLEELYSLSLEIRTKVREAVTPRRPQPATAMAMFDKELDVLTLALPYTGAMIEEVEDEEASQPKYTILKNEAKRKPTSFIVEDPIESYLSLLHPDEVLEQVIVAKKSHTLQSIYALIDNKEQVECVIDPGSQVISMSEEVYHTLGISYNSLFQITL